MTLEGYTFPPVHKLLGILWDFLVHEEWVQDFGADYVIADYDRVVEQVKEIASGEMADVVINSLGAKT